jgi:hypothetical protein
MSTSTGFHLALLGGLRRSGAWRVKARLIILAVIGGADLDFVQASFEAPETTLIKVSIIGGLSLRVPDDVRVEVLGLGVFSTAKLDPGPPAAEARAVLKVRAFGVLGGVKLDRIERPHDGSAGGSASPSPANSPD